MKFEFMDLFSKPYGKIAHQKSFEEIKINLFSLFNVMLSFLGMSLDALSNYAKFVSVSLSLYLCY